MKKKIFCIFSLLVLSFSAFSSSFSEAIEEAIEDNAKDKVENEDKSPKKIESSRSYSSNKSDSNSGLFEFILDLFGYLWLGTNIGVKYCEYPYQYEPVSGYVKNSIFENENTVSEYSEPKNLRLYRGSLDTSVFYMGELGFGNDTKFEAQFLFLGPYFENLIFSEHLDDFYSDYNGNIRLGGQFFLIQTNILNASFVAQWSKWYGNSSAVSKLGSGYSVGFDVKSYPLKPFALNWKTEWSGLKNNVGIFESILKAGMLFGRIEYNLCWRYMKMYNRNSDITYDKWNGISAGMKLYF